MININEIKDNMFGVVGFEQSYNPEYSILDSTLLIKSSGKSFNQYCSYITTENLKETQEYPDITDNDFNEWLTAKVKNSIVKGIDSCFDEKDLIENKVLFDNALRRDDSYLIDNNSDFVGYEICVSKKQDLLNVLNEIVLEFSGTGTIKILLFNANKKTLIQSKEINIDSSNKKESLTWELPYLDDVYGGKYYIGYLTNGLTPKAYNRFYENSGVQNKFSCLKINSIKVSGHNSETLFDIGDIDYVSQTWGLNFNISTYKEYTSLILSNKNIFADVIGYQFAADMLGIMLTTTRTDGIERLQKGNLLLELQGNFTNDQLPNVKGVEVKLKESIEKVKEMLTSIKQLQKFTVK